MSAKIVISIDQNRPKHDVRLLVRLAVFGLSLCLAWLGPYAFADDDCASQLIGNLGSLNLHDSLPLPVIRRIIKSNNQANNPDSLEFYNVTRGLQAYFYEEHFNFRLALLELRSGQVYLDLGGGDAGATSDYLTKDSILTWHYQRGKEVWTLPPKDDRAKAISISVDLHPSIPERRKALLASGRLAIYKTSLQQYAQAYPASADVISDMRGAIIYSYFDTAVADMISLLKPGGKGYFVGSFAHIKNAQGKDISTGEYLAKGTGFSVIASKEPNAAGVFEVTRTSGEITLPKLKYLKAGMTEDGPESWYRMVANKVEKR